MADISSFHMGYNEFAADEEYRIPNKESRMMKSLCFEFVQKKMLIRSRAS